MDPKITQALELLHEVFGSKAQIGMDIHHCDDLAEAVERIEFDATEKLTASDGHDFRYYRRRSAGDEITVYSGTLDKAGQLEAADEIADLKKQLEAAYAEDKPDIRRTAYYEGMGVGYDRGLEDGEERGWNTGYDVGHRRGRAGTTTFAATGNAGTVKREENEAVS